MRDATDAMKDAKDGDQQLQCWVFDDVDTSHYFMQGALHQTRAIELVDGDCIVVWNPWFVVCRHLKLLSVWSTESHHHYVQTTSLYQGFETGHMHCVLASLMHAYYSGMHNSGVQPLSQPHRKRAATELPGLFSVGFTCAS